MPQVAALAVARVRPVLPFESLRESLLQRFAPEEPRHKTGGSGVRFTKLGA